MKLTLDSTDDDACNKIQWNLDRARQQDRRGQKFEVEVVGPSLPLRSGLVVDPWHATVDFGGAEVWYWPTTGVAIQQLSRKANAFTQLAGGVNNVNLRAAAGAGAVAFDLRGNAANTRTSCRMQNLTAQGFGVGLQLSDYAFLTFIDGFIADGCGTGIRWLAGEDAGENVTIIGGGATNGTLGLDIQARGASLNLVGFSVDYNARAINISGSGSRVSMVCSHLEFPGATCQAGQVVVNGNGARFAMTEGDFLVSDRGGVGPYKYTHLVDLQHANAMAEFRGVRMHNHRNETDQWAIGPGRVHSDGPTYEVAMMPRRAHASQSMTPAVTGYVHQEQIPGTLLVSQAGNRVVGKRGNVGAGNIQVLGVALSVVMLRGRRLSLCLRLEAQMDASVGISAWWADGPTFSTQRTQLAQGNAWSSGQQNLSALPPTDVPVSSDLRVPSWATHMLLAVNVSGGTAGKWVAIDNVEIGAW